MDTYWSKIGRAFYDCRLDTYYNVLQYYRHGIDKSSYFLLAEPMDERCINLKLKMQGVFVQFPFIEYTKKEVVQNILHQFDVQREEFQFSSIEEEMEFVIGNVHRNQPIIVDVIGGYLSEGKVTSNIVISNTTTVPIVDYDIDKSEFIIGMRDLKSGGLLRINTADYKEARTKSVYPYAPSKMVFRIQVGSSSTVECNKEKLFQSCHSQIEYLKDKDLLLKFSKDSLSIFIDKKNIQSENDALAAVYAKQCGVLYSSMTLSSTSGYYYELYDAMNKSQIIKDVEISQLKKIGVAYKKLARGLLRMKQLTDSYSVEMFSREIEELYYLKVDVLSKILSRIDE